MSMIHSLEVRVPLLDRQLVALLLKYPTMIKTNGNEQPKPLLVKSLEGMLPSMVLNRRDKQGFTFPFAKWLNSEMQSKFHAVTDHVKTTLPINRDTFDHLLSQFAKGEIHWSRVWSIAALGCLE